MAEKWHSMKDYIVVEPAASENETDQVMWRSLSHKQFCILMFFISSLVMALSTLGICTNAANMLVFLKLKLNDGVEMSFFGLALTDFLSSCTNLAWALDMVTYALEIYNGPFFLTDPETLKHFFGHMATSLYSTSSLITVFIGIARCLCVLMPLKFKTIFSVKLCLFSMIVCYILGIAAAYPSMTTIYFVPKFIKTMNMSRDKIKNLPMRKSLRFFNTVVSHITIPLATQGLLMICVMVMVWALKRSSSFRQKAKASLNTEKSQENATGKLTQKELKIIQQVLLVCCVYLICNTPKMMVGVFTYFFDHIQDLGQSQGLARVYKLLNPSRRVFESVNSAVNIVIYHKYNPKFREYFNGSFMKRCQNKS